MPGGFFGGPRAAGAAAAGGLFFGDHDGAVRLARFAQLHRDRVRRIDFEEMKDAARERRAVKAMAEHLRGENVRHALDVIARARVALHPHAELAQLFDPAPHLLARDADFLGDFRAADHDRRVFGEQRQQRVNAPVGGAGQVYSAFRRHRWKLEGYMRKRPVASDEWLEDERLRFQLVEAGAKLLEFQLALGERGAKCVDHFCGRFACETFVGQAMLASIRCPL